MLEVLTLALTFPTVVYTVLLGVILVYWLFVMVGAVHLGEGTDGALEGAGGAAKGALEGAAKGALEGATKGVIEGATHALAGHDGVGDAIGDGIGDGAGDADLDASDTGNPGLLAALLSALRLKQIPATVALSVLVTFCWLVCVVAMQILSRTAMAGSLPLRLGVLVATPLLALPLSSLVCRPLAKALAQRKAPTKNSLIGLTCRVRTGKVTDRFGEATLEDGGAGLVVRVRVDGDAGVKRGDLALIVDWDAEKDSFLIEPLDSVMGEPKTKKQD